MKGEGKTKQITRYRGNEKSELKVKTNPAIKKRTDLKNQFCQISRFLSFFFGLPRPNSIHANPIASSSIR